MLMTLRQIPSRCNFLGRYGTGRENPTATKSIAKHFRRMMKDRDSLTYFVMIVACLSDEIGKCACLLPEKCGERPKIVIQHVGPRCLLFERH